jgi:FlaA1/EpsC-like NDP-sugar epimerase
MTALRNRHLFVSDILLLSAVAYLSFVLRLERWEIDLYWLGLAVFALTSAAAITLVFHRLGIYARFWTYASIDEVLLLAGGVTVGVLLASLISFGLVFAGVFPLYIPRSVPYIFLLLAIAATAGPRLLVRVAAGYRSRRSGAGAAARPVAIMGAGHAGVMIVREMQRNPQLGQRVVAFFDDDRSKRGMKISNVPVVGDRQTIPGAAARYRFKRVIIAMPTAPGRTIREIVDICERAGVEPKIIPGIYELLDGKVSVNQLRDIDIEDLLRRDPVRTDIEAVRQLVRGKRVLVTGGGGSIGGELCRQIWRCEPAQLILLGHGENSIFDIHNELRGLELKTKPPASPVRADGARGPKTNPSPSRLAPVIADVRFGSRILRVFEAYRPEIVFHAAAHKHVPLMELNPAEAITNNVLGTQNLLAAARAAGVERFVMISTDKAVNPTSIMGASKRVAELLVHQTAQQSGKAFVAVRFGNVLGSRGSVVNTFKRQIAAGGPVTVTHPDMERYFMTIPEAVQLVLQASVMGRGGEVFVLDMGEPVKIVDLARDLIELSGLEVGKDIDIAFTGARPGEKLFEELFIDGEDYTRTQHDKIRIAVNASTLIPDGLDEAVAALSAAAGRNDGDAIRKLLHNLLPEYAPTNGDPANNPGRGPDSPPEPGGVLLAASGKLLQT